MNIHIKDDELVASLFGATLVKTTVGSHLYGTNNEKSDIDYLHIYATSERELLSPVKVHHQLQYKADGIDYNFVSLHNFILNCINGDSTINFEVIHSNQLIGTSLEFLNDMKESFISYQLIRSYLGLCRRDIKHYHKAQTEYHKNKKLGHIVRGCMYADSMLKGEFDFYKVNKEFKSILNELDSSNNKQLREYEAKVSNLRELLNEKLNDGTIGYPQYMSFENLTLLDNELFNFSKCGEFLTKQKNLINFDNSYFLNSFENWVSY
jgi:predicted nucleotidyltransferase